MKASPDPHCRQLLTASRTNAEGLASPVRDGLCLLQGLLLCGVCGRRLGVRYTNRLIAATLETRWNDALQRLHDLEAELAAFERKTMRAVTAEQKRQILQLAKDFPRLWAASTTTPRDRKRILRLLVRDITVVKGPEQKLIRLQVRWQGGETEILRIQMPQNRADAIRYPETSPLAFESWRSTIMTMKSSPCCERKARKARRRASRSRSARSNGCATNIAYQLPSLREEP